MGFFHPLQLAQNRSARSWQPAPRLELRRRARMRSRELLRAKGSGLTFGQSCSQGQPRRDASPVCSFWHLLPPLMTKFLINNRLSSLGYGLPLGTINVCWISPIRHGQVSWLSCNIHTDRNERHLSDLSSTCYTEIAMLLQTTPWKFSKPMGEFRIFSSKHELQMQRTL